MNSNFSKGVFAGAILLAVVLGAFVGKTNAPMTIIEPEAQMQIWPDDHVLGNRAAGVVIYEYSEMECPFCKSFQDTKYRALAELGEENLAFVYRHYPIPEHKKSYEEALALECVAEYRGEDGFFAFMRRFFALTPSNDKSDLVKIFSQIATEVAIPHEDLIACIKSERHRERVLRDWRHGSAIGVTVVPHIIITAPNGIYLSYHGPPGEAAFLTLLKSLLKNSVETVPENQN